MNIEELIAASRWAEARTAIRGQLKAKPDSHWLLTRLGSTYYGQRKYGEALKYSERALQLAPECPLVLWDLACTLQMLEGYKSAISLFRWLAGWDLKQLAERPCGEGRAWARGLQADSFYRLSQCYDAQGRRSAADRAFVKHLDLRGPGCRSIYPLQELRQNRRSFRNSGARRRGPTKG